MIPPSAYVIRHPPVLAPPPFDPARSAIAWARWHDKSRAISDQALADAMDWAALPPARQWLEAIFGNSPYLTALALREPETVARLLEKGPEAVLAELLDGLRQEPPAAATTPSTMARLRVAKRRAALIIGMADVAELWPLPRVTEALSAVADLTLGLALRHLLLEAHMSGRISLADPARPEPGSGIVVIAMGKLGARELNYSSDIDLIVLFDPARIRVRARETVQSFVVRLTRDLVRLLEERTADGYVWRTDLRLRPDPGATPLAVSVEAAESYYGSLGQNWERAALIKARAAAGDLALGEAFLAGLQSFIWRKHLDFAAIRDIQSIKRQIDALHGAIPPDLRGHNIKLGHGGIREIEFFAQTQQLIWGGRLPHLRRRDTVEALEALVSAGRIEAVVAAELTRAYGILRRVEHRLQMIDDRQTHSLPTTEEEMAHLAVFLGCTDTAALTALLAETLMTVQRRFRALFPAEPPLAGAGNLVFTGAESDPETAATLSKMGFADPDLVATTIRAWHHGRIRATRSTRARELLTELMPRLLKAFGRSAEPDLAFARFDQFLARLPAGVQLLSLFQHRPELLELVAEIMGQSPLLAGHLARRPLLLDAVLTGDFFTPLPDDESAAIHVLDDELDVALGAPLGFRGHYEETLESVRRWGADRRFQIGVQLLRNRLDGERAGRDFSLIAERVIDRLLPVVWIDFERLHGRLTGGRFAVLALGKLGSREMNLLSDLDLTFIYTATEALSDGRKVLPPTAYFARLGQRLINALAAPMADGKLYEVDMRLRPSGAAGPIASSLDAFIRYHREQAWTWERMALTRARVVAGDPDLANVITVHIQAILSRPVEARILMTDATIMRRRMTDAHPNPLPWNCKHRRGALVDLEFIAQVLQLLHASTRPEILHWQTATAFRRLAAAGILSAADAETCLASLRLWQRCQQVLRALLGKTEDSPDVPQAAIDRAVGVTGKRSGLEVLDAAALAVMKIYQRVIGDAE